MARRDRPGSAGLEVWQAFLRTHRRLVDDLDRDLRDRHDLPLEWYDVLVQLTAAGGRMRMGDLAGAVLITPSNCTRLVDRLVAAGLVDRFADPDDARARIAAITTAGRRRLRAAAATHLAGVQRHFAGFAEEAGADQLLEFLGRVDRSVTGAGDPGADASAADRGRARRRPEH